MFFLHCKFIGVDLVVRLDKLGELERRAVIRAAVLMKHRELLYKLLCVIVKSQRLYTESNLCAVGESLDELVAHD